MVETEKDTVETLIEVGKELFSTNGYEKTITGDIVSRAGLTRGALYYHFDGKKGLFIAVFKSIYKDICDKILNAVARVENRFQELITINNTYMEISLHPEILQIFLVDGPAVLGWEEWRRIDEQYGMKILKESISSLIDEGYMKYQPIEALSHFISGGVNESILWIARSDNPLRALAETRSIWENFFRSLIQTEA